MCFLAAEFDMNVRIVCASLETFIDAGCLVSDAAVPVTGDCEP